MHSYRRDLDMLRDRRFTLLLVARTISVLGSSLAPVALAFGVLALPGATAPTLAVVLTAEALPMVAFILVGGVIADRLPRHRVMMAGPSGMTSTKLCSGSSSKPSRVPNTPSSTPADLASTSPGTAHATPDH
ncbi:MFS transporter [Nonomuraea africana]|uniref:MFS family permease n=1 Tax=Nonomuraea africana TaxID=46171 RepID=A0ABR9KNK7_9ACTN|nr:MFS transporter [Nonomuraea africana]MBE1563618.1 MFS family permease [Nonomuraea africana]